MGVIDLDIQGQLVILTRKRHWTSLLFTDLGRPRCDTRPNMLLYEIFFIGCRSDDVKIVNFGASNV